MAEQQQGEHTPAQHMPAIRHVIGVMRARLHEPLALADLAAEAYLSRYHFGRVFRELTGSSPGEFRGALRLDAARSLLLSTSLSVTDVCYEVGYSSLGSFTTRFTEHVGLAPTALRHLAAAFEPALVRAIGSGLVRPAASGQATLTGVLHGAPSISSTICVGLFARGIPHGLPVACTQVADPGPFRIANIPDGVYYLFAAALPWSDNPLLYLAPSHGLLVASHPTPIRVSGGGAQSCPSMRLHAPADTNPPLVSSLPLLLARWATHDQASPPEQTYEERTIGEAPAIVRC